MYQMGTTGVLNGYHGCTKSVPGVYPIGTTGVPNGITEAQWSREALLGALALCVCVWGGTSDGICDCGAGLRRIGGKIDTVSEKIDLLKETLKTASLSRAATVAVRGCERL